MPVWIPETTPSTNTLTGALVVSGGLGVAKNINCNGNAIFTGTVSSLNNTALRLTGFEDRTLSTLTYNPTTRLLSVTATGSEFGVWVDGVRYVFSNISLAHPNTRGGYWYTINNSGNLQYEAYSYTSIDFNHKAMVALVYYYDTSIYAIMEDRHAVLPDINTHVWMHTVVGTFTLVGSFPLTGYTLNTDTDAAVKYTINSGIMWDEDLQFTVPSVSSPNYLIAHFQQDSYPDNWTVWTTGNTFPYVYTVGGYINYNILDGSNKWVYVQAVGNKWLNYYISGATYSTGALAISAGRTQYDTLEAALNEVYTQQLYLSSFIPPEFVALYQITYKTSNSYTNTGKCVMAAVTRLSYTRSTIFRQLA